MHIHILGVCGTFMGSLAQLAKAMGHRVTGCDANVYPPMSTQLASAGIELIEGFAPEQLDLDPDLVVVGNVVSRGNPLMEAVLDRGQRYISGPQWLSENLLQNKWVLAVAGTHGKTTTSSMLAWILEYAGMSPGYLIGGVPGNFGTSARLGESDFFVIEADEYDTAFFDKRSKFVHYQPKTLVINNLEYDHADIFPDLAAIQRQFHHVVRTVPSLGAVIYDNSDTVRDVIDMGCWSERQSMAADLSEDPLSDWSFNLDAPDGRQFTLSYGEDRASVTWELTGQHNVKNALSAIAAARHVGITVELAAEALCQFQGVKRRMECVGEVGGVYVYDDFAHHPTAIATTLAGLRNKVGDGGHIIAVIEPRSNTMKQGVHNGKLLGAVMLADYVLWHDAEGSSSDLGRYVSYDKGVAAASGDNDSLVLVTAPLKHSAIYNSIDAILVALDEHIEAGTHVVIMSNGGFAGIHARLLARLASRAVG